MNKRNIAIGDIHGCKKTLEKLLFEVIKIDSSDVIYLLGDYIDRGPDSKGVIDLIMDLQDNDFQINCLRGNHDDLMLKSYQDTNNYYLWRKNGASKTLESFGVQLPWEIPLKYIEFFDKLDYYYELEDKILVHAGLNFHIDNPLSDKESMLWIRTDYVAPSKINNKKIVVGHTPSSLDKIKHSLNSNKIMLDNGCVMKSFSPDLGNLVAMDLDSYKLYIQENIEND